MRIPLIAGNWKMYKNADEAAAFAEEFKKLEVEFLNKLDETMFKDKKYYESIK